MIEIMIKEYEKNFIFPGEKNILENLKRNKNVFLWNQIIFLKKNNNITQKVIPKSLQKIFH